jgi:hypothetical protein
MQPRWTAELGPNYSLDPRAAGRAGAGSPSMGMRMAMAVTVLGLPAWPFPWAPETVSRSRCR